MENNIEKNIKKEKDITLKELIVICILIIVLFSLAFYNFQLERNKNMDEIYNYGLKECEKIGKKEFFSKLNQYEQTYSKNPVDNSIKIVMQNVIDKIEKNCKKE